ncbi:MAG: radical SAM protein [Candidatus Kryptonium sp.]|nr:radical SAM protein [Candidatus Kryptonium sp.]MDW8109383.1 radical SAM protein [Candidatus Kryptonium sp.]
MRDVMINKHEPSYIELNKKGILKERVEILKQILNDCTLCPRNCHVNRNAGRKGKCRVGSEIIISGVHPHFGEEPCLVGTHGSGTIFFASCNMNCIYCQNYEISRFKQGEVVSVFTLADAMLYLQKIGCHNINLVTPTHYVPQIVEAISIAVNKGLKIPIVYNCGGYESVETLKLLEGIVDIYMPDIKYSDNSNALKYSGVPNYWDVVREAVKEMWRQVGDLEIVNGVAVKGLLIRHLVLPNGIAGSEKVFEFIANEISKNTYVNIMAQYRPYFNAFLKPEIARRITIQEYRDAVQSAQRLGLRRIELSPWY